MLRVLPWMTDGAVDFLNTYIANRAATRKLAVFEYGCGNSTLYFLSRGCQTTAVDHSLAWLNTVCETAKCFGYGSSLTALYRERPYVSEYTKPKYDIVSIDGRDRVACLRHVLNIGLAPQAILLLDNTERINGGPYSEYVELLKDFFVMHFEQARIRGVAPSQATYYDKNGLQVPHRWITSIAYRSSEATLTTAGNNL